MSKAHPIRITITGPGSTFCFEAEIIKRALRAEGVEVEVVTNYDCCDGCEDGNIDNLMEEARRRMQGDWSEGKGGPRDEFNLGKVERAVIIIEDHQPWGG